MKQQTIENIEDFLLWFIAVPIVICGVTIALVLVLIKEALVFCFNIFRMPTLVWHIIKTKRMQ